MNEEISEKNRLAVNRATGTTESDTSQEVNGKIDTEEIKEVNEPKRFVAKPLGFMSEDELRTWIDVKNPSPSKPSKK